MITTKAKLFCLLSTVVFTAAANAASPALVGIDYFGNSDEPQRIKLAVQRLDVRVHVRAGYAETRVNATFFNHTEELLEADFTLALPGASIVTGYRLDIDGRTVDGELIEKLTATRILNERIRQGVDPGVGEKTARNDFHTRVYPVQPNASRVVGVTFVTSLGGEHPYELPLDSEQKIEHFSLQVTADGERPTVSSPEGVYVRWRDGLENIGEANARSLVLNSPLTIVPGGAAEVSVEEAGNGMRMLGMMFSDQQRRRPVRAGTRVRVYWDASLSHADAAGQESQFLSDLIADYVPGNIELLTFSNKHQILDTTGGVQNEIRNVFYHGATNLEALFESQTSRNKVDVCYLFSDARSTLGDFPQALLPCRLFTVTAAHDADRGRLALLAQRGGGRFIDLVHTDHERAKRLARMRGAENLSVVVDGVDRSDQAEWMNDGGTMRIVLPIAHDSRNIRVRYGKVSRRYSIPRQKIHTGEILKSVWAERRLQRLRASGSPRAELVSFSQAHSVASEETAFIVLESVDDYAANKIALPGNTFSNKDQQRYAQLLFDAERAEREAEDQRMDLLAASWDELRAWYERDFSAGNNDQTRQTNDNPDTSTLHQQPASGSALLDREFSRDANLQETVTTASRKRQPSQGRSTTVTISEWSPDREYLQAVEGLCGVEFWSEYQTQTRQYGKLPAFFLENSDVAKRCGDIALAEEIALSALELPAADTATMASVAHRLLDIGSDTAALELLQKVTDIEPHRAHAWRYRALALVKAAQRVGTDHEDFVSMHLEALGHLNKIISSATMFNDTGVALIVVMEANRIVALLQNMGVESNILDKRLRQLMDVDLRIVLSWNADAVDIDLWVDEPTGERAKFSHSRTLIGGRLSNDVTNGYGPEEYLLRRAKVGEYKIRADYYGSDILNPNGAVVLRVTVFTNWGRENEAVEVLDLEFSSTEEEEYLVAKVVID